MSDSAIITHDTKIYRHKCPHCQQWHLYEPDGVQLLPNELNNYWLHDRNDGDYMTLFMKFTFNTETGEEIVWFVSANGRMLSVELSEAIVALFSPILVKR